jgi:fatty acid desaturase
MTAARSAVPETSPGAQPGDDVAHPHDLVDEVPDRLAPAIVRELSQLAPARALRAVAEEWLGVAAAITVAVVLDHPVADIAAIVFIGARQQAMTVLGHDAAHFRFLRNRRWNDWLADLTLQWPTFISVTAFRKFHGAHHRFLSKPDDGNRFLWNTHDKDGALRREWTYPKSVPGLLGVLLWRGCGLTGVFWILRGLIGIVAVRSSWANAAARLLYMGGIAAVLTLGGWWWQFFLYWVVPMCTWHIVIQYMRLIAEHSVVGATAAGYAETRTTIPNAVERLLMLPRNIGYHLEHHWYPSVPWYNLPALHGALMELPRFREEADVSPSLLSSMAAVTRA